MSYLTVVPNCYYASGNQMGQVPNQYVLNSNQFNTNNVLNFLKSALTLSLTNYQQNYQQTPAEPQSTSLPPNIQAPTQEITPKALELLQFHEENKEIPCINLESHENVNTDKEGSLQGRENKREAVVLTEDELLLDDKQKQSKKTQPSKRRGKKVKEEVIDTFVVPIPKVDLIETAYLALFPLNRSTLAQKREELLLRRVGEWSQTMKSKKDKRQIRNLAY